MVDDLHWRGAFDFASRAIRTLIGTNTKPKILGAQRFRVTRLAKLVLASFDDGGCSPQFPMGLHRKLRVRSA